MAVWISGGGIVSAGDVADDAITQPCLAPTTATNAQCVVATTSTPTTTSTSYVLLSDMTITMSVRADSKVGIQGQCVLYNAGNFYFGIMAYFEGNPVAECYVDSVAGIKKTCSVNYIGTPASAGTKTYAIYWKCSSGTNYAYLLNRQISVVEYCSQT